MCGPVAAGKWNASHQNSPRDTVVRQSKIASATSDLGDKLPFAHCFCLVIGVNGKRASLPQLLPRTSSLPCEEFIFVFVQPKKGSRNLLKSDNPRCFRVKQARTQCFSSD
jgi:hypothetical protein